MDGMPTLISGFLIKAHGKLSPGFSSLPSLYQICYSNGSNISFWEDPWQGIFSFVNLPLIFTLPQGRVSSLASLLQSYQDFQRCLSGTPQDMVWQKQHFEVLKKKPNSRKAYAFHSEVWLRHALDAPFTHRGLRHTPLWVFVSQVVMLEKKTKIEEDINILTRKSHRE